MCLCFVDKFTCILFFKFLFIIFGCCWAFVVLHGLSVAAANGGYSSLWCVGFSLWWLLLLGGTSLVCGLPELWRTGLLVPRHVESSWTRNPAHILCIDRWILIHWATTEDLCNILCPTYKQYHDVCLCLTYSPSMIISRPTHVAANEMCTINICIFRWGNWVREGKSFYFSELVAGLRLDPGAKSNLKFVFSATILKGFSDRLRNLRIQTLLVSQITGTQKTITESSVQTQSYVYELLLFDLWGFSDFCHGFPGSSAGKESACNAGDRGSILRSGRSAGEGIGYPLQYSQASLWLSW